MLNNKAEAVVTVSYTINYNRNEAQDYNIDDTDRATQSMDKLAERMVQIDLEEFGPCGIPAEMNLESEVVSIKVYEVEDD